MKRILLISILAMLSLPSYAQTICWSIIGSSSMQFPAQTISSAADGGNNGTAVSSGATNNSIRTTIVQINASLDCNDGSGLRGVVVIPGTAEKNAATYTQNGVEHAVWDTGVPGVGIAMAARGDEAGDWIPITSREQSIGTIKEKGGSTNPYINALRATLVFTGRLKTGVYNINIKPVYTTIQKSTSKVLRNATMSIVGTVTVKAGSCRLASGATQSVTMPKVSVYGIEHARDTSGVSSSPFSFGLQCDPEVKVYATMTDASNPLNLSDTLSLGAGSTARGVGIQIYRENETTPVRYGPDSSVSGNSNQWYVGTAGSNGVVGLSFRAKYAATGTTITAGSVKAQSTITFSYQ
ncbi:fimbrial protein [Burkholderia ubonensis]|uniref:fimbrial protein n=1 Tax=Burkholderia ubonensis TaxID=101571 RepID=UPI000BA6DF2D|nr:fimbrial protein [Burkholderia ubonensis]PAK12442.1 hypothetical protein CJO66_22965 [Burkholderia ubonensis]RQP28882.1 fimbrial protein [Burkholderia ubonensis]RQP31808.1 fimbrial protein [Burkholderia ubonensis]RQP34316.1 fimbrial protein [Burkholderia ubonensis]RQP49360.1 fimbrial protein [Burkholderia ubonensis]